jgi:hypothetical protein
MSITSSIPQRPGPAFRARRAKRLLGVGAAGCVVAVLAACSSSSSASPSAPNGSQAPSSSPAAPASAAATPASLSQLKKIVLQPADLPSGWKGTPYQADPNNAAENGTLAACVGARDTDSDQVAEANSDDFGLGNATITSSATSYRSQSDLVNDIAALHSPKLSSCFSQMMKKQLASSLPAGTKVTSASIKVTPGSAGGPANVIATGTGTVQVQVNGQQIPLYLSVAFITGPLIQAEVDAENPGTPVPASVVNRLAATVATRAAKG